MANVVCSPTDTVRFVHRVVIALIVVCGVRSAASAQTTVTLSTPGSHITADLTIQGGRYGMVDFSTSDELASKVSSEDYTRRILLKFDTEQIIPADAVIQSARLHLVLKTAESSEARPLTAFYVTRSFGKGETNWYYFRYGQGWSTPGGDLGQRFGTTYVGNRVGSTYTFDLTRLVQRAVNGEFGSSRYTRVALVDTGGWSEGNYRSFHSTRADSAALRPSLVVTYTGSANSSESSNDTLPSAAATSTSTTSTGSTLRVMQWNVHKTKGADGRCNADRIANAIVAQKAHVVSLNEVNFFSGECAYDFDMGQKLQSLLQQKTGVTWYRQEVNVEGGSRGYGNVLLSRYRPVTASSTLLSNSRGVAQIGIVVNGRTINLFSTHVEYVNASWRPKQIAEALRWMSTFSSPRVVMGDFNTSPNTSDYWIVATPYQDAWAAAESARTATAYDGSEATHGKSRFDYVFYSRVAALSLKSANVPDTRIKGVHPSDHDPVIAVFSVK